MVADVRGGVGAKARDCDHGGGGVAAVDLREVGRERTRGGAGAAADVEEGRIRGGGGVAERRLAEVVLAQDVFEERRWVWWAVGVVGGGLGGAVGCEGRICVGGGVCLVRLVVGECASLQDEAGGSQLGHAVAFGRRSAGDIYVGRNVLSIFP